MKQVLDITQMQHLQELGLDTSNASMLHCEVYDAKPILVESKHRFEKVEDAIILDGIRDSVIYCKKVTPAYTLQDVLDTLPKYIHPMPIEEITFGLWIGSRKMFYANMANLDDVLKLSREAELIDAAYSMLCWCIENGYVESIKEDKK